MGHLAIAVLGVGMLLILGGLVGHSLSQHLMSRQIREQAAFRRELGARRRAAPCLTCPWADSNGGISSNLWTGG